MLIVLTTTPDRALANKLADKLVTERLAACVQVLPQMTSVYLWEGEIQKDDEYLLLIKTLPEKYAALEALIHKIHSYDTPEIIAIESAEVSSKYRKWMEGYLGS